MHEDMTILEHLGTAWKGLGRWILAQMQDSVLVGILWLAGLWIIDVPLAPLWAFLAMLLQFIPHLGPILSLIGPVCSTAFFGSGMQTVYVLILYAVIVSVDGFVLQPVLMKRNAKVPVWASILTPIVLGLLFNVWGLLLAAPLLAVVYAYREQHKRKSR